MVHHLAIGVVEGRQAVDHLVNQNAQRPPVHALSVGHFAKNFGRQVFGSSAERLRGVALHVLLGQTEVRDANVPFRVQEQVFWL